MLNPVGVFFIERATSDYSVSCNIDLDTKTRPDGTKVAVHPDGTELAGCDAETALVWVGGLHNEFVGSVSTCISKILFVDGAKETWTTDPWTSITAAWLGNVRRVRMTLDAVGGYGAARMKVTLWA